MKFAKKCPCCGAEILPAKERDPCQKEIPLTPEEIRTIHPEVNEEDDGA